MMNRLAPFADAEAANQRGRLLIAGYAVKRLSASLYPRDRRESGMAVPRGAHRARSALSASTRESGAAARAARETRGVLGRNGEAPSDRSLGASVYRPSPKLRDERKMAPEVGLEPTTNRLTADRSTTELLRNVGAETVSGSAECQGIPSEETSLARSFSTTCGPRAACPQPVGFGSLVGSLAGSARAASSASSRGSRGPSTVCTSTP